MQVSQQLFMQRREQGEMPGGACPHFYARQGDLCTGKRFQDARAGRPPRRVGGRALIEARSFPSQVTAYLWSKLLFGKSLQ